MRAFPALAAAVALASAAVMPMPALAKNQTRYEYDGRYYETHQQCMNAKKKAQQRGTIVGAATAGVGAALLGGNLGQSALIAGGGALVGNQLGKSSKKC